MKTPRLTPTRLEVLEKKEEKKRHYNGRTKMMKLRKNGDLK